MADDLLNLGSTPIFPFSPNWASSPSTGMLLSRSLLQYTGTAPLITSVTDLVPQTFDAGFTFYNKEEEYEMLEFLHSIKGKNKRFWIFHPKNSFVLKTEATSGSTLLVCYPNRAYSSYQGFERIWIRMNNGDILTRHVSSVTYDPIAEEMNVFLSDNLDRDVTPTNHNLIGRVLLVRFDVDEFSFDVLTDIVSESKFRFFELVKEYDLI